MNPHTFTFLYQIMTCITASKTQLSHLNEAIRLISSNHVSFKVHSLVFQIKGLTLCRYLSAQLFWLINVPPYSNHTATFKLCALVPTKARIISLDQWGMKRISSHIATTRNLLRVPFSQSSLLDLRWEIRESLLSSICIQYSTVHRGTKLCFFWSLMQNK